MQNQEEEEKNLDTTLLLEPNNEEAIYMLINIQLDRSNFEKANTLMNRFGVIYKDEKFAREIQHLASDVSSVERSPEDWETNEYLQKIQDFANSINKELKEKNINN